MRDLDFLFGFGHPFFDVDSIDLDTSIDTSIDASVCNPVIKMFGANPVIEMFSHAAALKTHPIFCRFYIRSVSANHFFC